MLRFLRATTAAALDLLFPPGCAACDDPLDDAGLLCAPCAATLVPLERACPRCALPRGGVGACVACAADPPPHDGARSLFAFGGAIADALRALKFAGRVDLGARLGAALAPLVEADALVIPVPLSRRRLAARGYNQAALIALGAVPGARVRTDLIFRVRETPAQVGQGQGARRAALRGAFAAAPDALAGRAIVLIDDVMTTGATLAACAEAARAAGAARVLALTVARALP